MSSPEPLVSVIISCYNHAAYVEKSLRSVLDQSYRNIELLVYDDGSRDDSVAIIQSLADRHGFFFQAHKNKGLAATLNEGLARARGEFIAPFASDDIMCTDRFEKQVPWLQARPEVGIAAGGYEFIDEQGTPDKKPRKRPKQDVLLDFDDIFFGRTVWPAAPTLLIRHDLMKKVGGYDAAIPIEDLYMQLKITEMGYKVGVMTEKLSYYRRHGANTVKRNRFLHDNLLRTLALYAGHPGYPQAKYSRINSMLLRTSDRDKAMAKELLHELPLRFWNMKTVRAIWRLYTQPVRPS